MEIAVDVMLATRTAVEVTNDVDRLLAGKGSTAKEAHAVGVADTMSDTASPVVPTELTGDGAGESVAVMGGAGEDAGGEEQTLAALLTTG